MIVEEKSRLPGRLLLWSSLILAGIVLGGVGVSLLIYRDQPEQKSEEQIRREYVIEYTNNEELRLGIKCHNLKATLRDFLARNVNPLLVSRRGGQGWSELVNDETRREMEIQREYFFTCGRLYAAGRNGEWNGLGDLGDLMRLEREFVTLNTLIRFGEPRHRCDAKCRDDHFRDLKDVVDRISAGVS